MNLYAQAVAAERAAKIARDMADHEANRDFLVAEAYRCGLETGVASGAASRDDEVYALKDELKREQALSFRNQVAEFEQQLAAAQAAIKAKDEALRFLLNERSPDSYDDAFAALAIQPDDSALKAWLGEPVAWMNVDTQGGALFFRNEVCHVMATPLYTPK